MGGVEETRHRESEMGNCTRIFAEKAIVAFDRGQSKQKKKEQDLAEKKETIEVVKLQGSSRERLARTTRGKNVWPLTMSRPRSEGKERHASEKEMNKGNHMRAECSGQGAMGGESFHTSIKKNSGKKGPSPSI